MNNSTCQKFYRQINNEVAAGQQFDYLKVEALQNQIITSEAKRHLGFPVEAPLTLHDFAKESVEVLPKLRLIYLLALLEAFAQEYLAQRESVPLENVRKCLSAQQSKWKRKQTGVLSSDSLLNLAYLRFALHDRYGTDFSSVQEQCFWEAGPLRNCLVHHGGAVPSEAFRIGLQNCILELGAADAVGSVLVISDKFVWTYIQAGRTFLTACDY